MYSVKHTVMNIWHIYLILYPKQPEMAEVSLAMMLPYIGKAEFFCDFGKCNP